MDVLNPIFFCILIYSLGMLFSHSARDQGELELLVSHFAGCPFEKGDCSSVQPSSNKVAKREKHPLLSLEDLNLSSVQSTSVCCRLQWCFGASAGLLGKKKIKKNTCSKKLKVFMNRRNFLNGRFIKTRSFHRENSCFNKVIFF